MNRSRLACTIALLIAGNHGFGQRVVVTPSPAPGPLNNPLKGWAPYAEQGTSKHYQACSMVFHYASWRELEPTEGHFAFKGFEAKWESALSHGKRVILRVYLDYPSAPTGVPQWLIDQGVKMTPYTEYGGGKSPDYSDPRLVNGLRKLIRELGKRYSKHPRVAIIQVGMLGFWGEWHTYPRNELFAPESVQRTVVADLHTAFPNKHLEARSAKDYPGTLPWIGYHDDMIPADTVGPDNWMWWPVMKRAGRTLNWQVAPMGGEMVPGAARKYTGPEFAKLQAAVETCHLSWIGPYCPAVEELKGQALLNCQAIVRRMGYEYRIAKVEYNATLRRKQATRVSLNGANQGVAPFYYPWAVQLALLNADRSVRQSIPVDADIRTWSAGGVFHVSSSFIVTAPVGSYRLAVGIIDPWKREPAIGFANDLERVDGWTVIGQVTVK